jgi:hypothetical protein
MEEMKEIAEYHKFRTFWLWLMITVNVMMTAFYFYTAYAINKMFEREENTPYFIDIKHHQDKSFYYGVIVLGIIGLVNILAASLLRRLKKPGYVFFRGLCVSTIILMAAFSIVSDTFIIIVPLITCFSLVSAIVTSNPSKHERGLAIGQNFLQEANACFKKDEN